jgi:hypothetical protein
MQIPSREELIKLNPKLTLEQIEMIELLDNLVCYSSNDYGELSSEEEKLLEKIINIIKLYAE